MKEQPAVLSELIPAYEMANARAMINEWLPELTEKLNAYIDKLMSHLFDIRKNQRGQSFDDELEAWLEAKENAKKLGIVLSPRAVPAPRAARASPTVAAAAAAAAALPSGRPSTKTPSGRPGTRQRLPPPPKP